MIKSSKATVMLLGVFFIALACGGEKDTAMQTEVSLNNGETLEWDGNSKFLVIQTEDQWNVTLSYVSGQTAWCTLSVSSGVGSKNIVLITTENNSENERSVTITVSTKTDSKTLTLTQKAKPKGYGGGDGEEEEIPKIEKRLELPKIDEPRWYREYYGEISLEYSIAQKHAKWVAWPLHAGYLGSGRNDSWKFDNTLNPYNPVYGRTGEPNDYRDQIDLTNPLGIVSYNRGHLCPSGDRNATPQYSAATFYYSNMSPQIGDFNGGIWGRLETTVRKWAENAGDTLYICAGGSILKTEHIALHTVPSSMAVPKYYFKVILRKRGQSTYDAIGFWFEHKKYLDNNGKTVNTVIDNIDLVMKSVDEIEALTGIDFFYNLPEDIQNTVEAMKNKSDWIW